MSEATRLLEAASAGDRQAAADLLPLVYEELRKLAAGYLASERPGQTLQPTALVHEAYLRLIGSPDGAHWDSRGHFFAAAARAMRCLLIDAARRKKATRHGGGAQQLDADELPLVAPEVPEDLIALDEALDRLAERDPVKARVVELRYFAGLTIDEAAAALGISPATAKRHWAYSRAWLFREIMGEPAEENPSPG
jgi:RNA polymerase sigma factor (TIGR02999 family)